jgi:uncharacterized membrane protein HdeD (DUF308 family)
MSQETQNGGAGRSAFQVDSLSRLSEHWGLALTFGMLTFGLGVVLAVWPKQTVTVVAVLIAIQFLVSGVLRVVASITAHSLEGGMRVLLGVAGALALIVGLIILRHPVQTLLVITLILGAWWVLSGVIEIIGAVMSPRPGRRGWDVAMGVISILAGGFLLIDPSLSLGVLVALVCAWLLVIGGLTIIAAFKLRAVHHAGAPSPAAPAAPAV